MSVYINGYTNPKDILVDFVFEVCFNNEQPEDRWSLVYPEASNKVEAREMILEERRATISTTFRNKKEWINNEKKYVADAIDNGQKLTFKLDFPLIKGGQVRVRLEGKKPLYRNTEEEMSVMEFSIDEKTSEVHIFKAPGHEADEGLFYAIDYEREGLGHQTWYVALEYPTFDVLDDDHQNRYFLAWKFGKEIDLSYNIADNKGFQCPYITTYWHTDNLLEYPIGDWLPIEYFIQVDKKSISFVFCEDPVYLEQTVHGFGYIGALDEVPGALKSDNEGNFGSGGNHLTGESLENIFIGSKGRTEPSKEKTVSLKVYERLYSKTTGAAIRERLILTLNNVPLEVGEHEYDDLIRLDLDALLIDLGLEDDYIPLSGGRDGFNWYCNFVKIEEDPVPKPEVPTPPEKPSTKDIRIKHLDIVTNQPIRTDIVLPNQSGEVTVSGEEVDGYELIAPKSHTINI